MKQKKMFSLVPVIALVIALMAPQAASAISEEDVRAMLNTMNDQLAVAGENFRITNVEYYTELSDPDNVGQIVYVNDREKQLTSHWVPGDPNRWGTTDIYWLTDLTPGESHPTGMTEADAQAAIGSAMNTWNTTPCATIPLIQWPDFGIDWGYVQYLAGMGGIPGWYADITQAGWLPGAFFDWLAPPDGSTYILGVTFTFIWIDTATGNPTDLDGNGKTDVAFKEIYYNDNFPWSNDGTAYDVETVALHEMGHGLSLGHFGKIFRTTSNGKLHFSPRCVMNAAYSGIQRELQGVDNSSFCSIWSSWPNN